MLPADCETIAQALRARGLDLCAWFSSATWNKTAPPGEELEDFGLAAATCAVIGNTRALWESFIDDLRRAPAHLEAARPLDAYVERSVAAALDGISARHTIVFGHVGPPFAPLQRLAGHAGLAWLSPAQLSVHPVYGPWIALRAVISLELQPTFAPPPPASPPARCECARSCEPALARALATTTSAGPDEPLGAAWVAVRDACPVGSAHRYAETQLAYHYSKDRELLRQAVAAAG